MCLCLCVKLGVRESGSVPRVNVCSLRARAPLVKVYAYSDVFLFVPTGRRYCPMLVVEGGVIHLATLKDTSSNPMVQQLATGVLELIEKDHFSLSDSL